MLCKGAATIDDEGNMNAHKNLLDSVMKANDEYNKMKNQIVDMQRVIAMQKLMKDKYQEELRMKQNELEQLRREKTDLEKKFQESKRKLNSLHSVFESAIKHQESEML